MNTKTLMMSLVTSALMQLPTSFATEFLKETDQQKVVINKKFEFYPVKVTKKETQETWELNGQYLLPLTKTPVAKFENFSYKPVVQETPGLEIQIDQRSAGALEKATQKYLNFKLAIVYNGQVLLAPTVKSIIKGGQLYLTFKDAKKFEDLVENLKTNPA